MSAERRVYCHSDDPRAVVLEKGIPPSGRNDVFARVFVDARITYRPRHSDESSRRNPPSLVAVLAERDSSLWSE